MDKSPEQNKILSLSVVVSSLPGKLYPRAGVWEELCHDMHIDWPSACQSEYTC